MKKKKEKLMAQAVATPAGDDTIVKQKVAIVAQIVNEVIRLESKVIKNGDYGMLKDIKDFYKTFFPLGENKTDCERIEDCLHIFFTQFYKYYEGKRGCGMINKLYSEYVRLFP
jgi:hypothetical protein